MRHSLLKSLTLFAFICLTASAWGIDWSTIGWVSNSNDKYKVGAADAANLPNVINVQHPGWAAEDGIYMTFPAAGITCTHRCAVDGAGICLYISQFTALETEVTVTYAGGAKTFVIYYADGTSAPASTETIYFVNTNGWSGVRTHLWNEDASAATPWPGIDATQETATIFGYSVWSQTQDAGKYTNVVFNNAANSSDKTNDLVWTPGKYCVNEVWYTLDELYTVKLMGITDWTTGLEMTTDRVNHTCSYTCNLTAGNYQFKFYNAVTNTWFGDNSENNSVNRDFPGGWALVSPGTYNVNFTADVDGAYTFTFDYVTYEVSVAFPKVFVSECTGALGHFATPENHVLAYDFKYNQENRSVSIRLSSLTASPLDFVEIQIIGKGNYPVPVTMEGTACYTESNVVEGQEYYFRFLYSTAEMPGNEMSAETLTTDDPLICYVRAGDCTESSPATELDNVDTDAPFSKMILDGQLIIIRDGVRYNAMGQIVE